MTLSQPMIDDPLPPHQSQVVSQELFHQLLTLGESRFTGRADIQSLSGLVTRFYFCMGRLVWFSGGYDPVQRCRRLVTQFCSKRLELSLSELIRVSQGEQGYKMLTQLLHQEQIRRDQMIALIETAVSELLFDLMQEQEQLPQDSTGLNAFDIHTNTEDVVDSPITMLRVESMIEQACSTWQIWKTAGLAAYSPNLAPVIRSEKLLRSQTAPQTFNVLSSVINGQRTLRTLALKMNQDIIALTRALLPYVTRGIIGLVEGAPEVGFPSPTTDILPHSPKLPRSGSGSNPGESGPLVVCIDDSPHVVMSLQQTLAQSHYRFEAITDPVQAIPSLLKLTPDLIFLDLVMPVVNGYELCAQIRRISTFKQTPIIILTSNDGMIDRVRTRFVGASDFLSKPINKSIVLDTLARFFPDKGVDGKTKQNSGSLNSPINGMA